MCRVLTNDSGFSRGIREGEWKARKNLMGKWVGERDKRPQEKMQNENRVTDLGPNGSTSELHHGQALCSTLLDRISHLILTNPVMLAVVPCDT